MKSLQQSFGQRRFRKVVNRRGFLAPYTQIEPAPATKLNLTTTFPSCRSIFPAWWYVQAAESVFELIKARMLVDLAGTEFLCIFSAWDGSFQTTFAPSVEEHIWRMCSHLALTGSGVYPRSWFRLLIRISCFNLSHQYGNYNPTEWYLPNDLVQW